MTFRAFLTVVSVCALAAVPAAAQARRSATAELKDAQGKVVGKATFKPAHHGVEMTVSVKALTPGEHALHIHGVGKCEAPGFTSAGPHFNPEGKKHGMKNPEGHHAGDLPNMTVDAKGSGKWKGVVEGVTLGEGKTSLFHPEGTAVVIHEKADDNTSDPAGNAGGRIACGVIK
jgi:Cu-Zn family superoxide dismutase